MRPTTIEPLRTTARIVRPNDGTDVVHDQVQRTAVRPRTTRPGVAV